MQNILKEIIAIKKKELILEKQKKSFFEVRNKAEFKYKYIKTKKFKKRIVNKILSGNPAIIAEIKRASPSKGLINNNFNPSKIAINYIKYGATCLSVVTDNFFFLGSYKYLSNIRNICKIPILCKDFIIDSYQIYNMYLYGADAILLIVSALSFQEMLDLELCANSLGMDVLVEVHNISEINIASKLKTLLFGINNRNLNTFKISLDTTKKLLSYIPNDKLIITESGILSANDIKKMLNLNINIFLIGETFMKNINPGLKLSNFFYNIKNF